MNHPRMTASGRRWAFLIAVAIAFFVPKRVECGVPDGEPRTCGHKNVLGRWCTEYEVEPLGIYFFDRVTGSNRGFVYSSGEECH